LFNDYSRARQNGITDPRWPATFEAFIHLYESTENGTLSQLESRIGKPRLQQFRKQYIGFAGHRQPQEFLTLVLADLVTTGSPALARRADLERVLRKLTWFSFHQMQLPPAWTNLKELDYLAVPDSYRVTVTVGFGASLFVTPGGDDRFGIRAFRPRRLGIMPRLHGEATRFDPAREAADLAVMICSDHPYVNVAVARALAKLDTALRVRAMEQGFSRPDRREFLRFDDGIANIRGEDLDHMIYVRPSDGEPGWCENGSYMVYLKIAEDLTQWESLTEATQEQMIGRRKGDGVPLSSGIDPTGRPEGLIPVYGPPSAHDAPFTAHIRKVQPRRQGEDLMGVRDTDRRFLRRAYPFFDGVDSTGRIVAGLQFIGFMRDLRAQFEWVTQVWQMNPNFPVPGAGIDAMFGGGIFRALRGGYYFCPPAPSRPAAKDGLLPDNDYFGSAMFGKVR
jgi:deferrochelatase/peroxidase EfeB